MLSESVAEIHGEYGAVCVSELLIQKIWLRQEFDAHSLQTLGGDSLRVLDPGRWNRLDGPDFRDAELIINGVATRGDVEIHFYRRDWNAHGHQHDPGFANVVLHVLVFPPLPSETEARTLRGRSLPTVVLLPYLRKDLETFAMGEALRSEGNADPLNVAARLLEMPLFARLQILRDRSRQRWRRKVQRIGETIVRLGWEQALHEGCMEALGYRRNRTPMQSLASRYSIRRMQTDQLSAEDLFKDAGGWRLNGLRPANHPKARLAQYLNLVRLQPDWPTRIRSIPLPQQAFDASSPTSRARRQLDLTALQDYLQSTALAGAIGGARFHTLCVDLFLPALAALAIEDGRDHDLDCLFGLWHHWRPGDFPDGVRQILSAADVLGSKRVACNGLFQGCLQLCLEGVRWSAAA